MSEQIISAEVKFTAFIVEHNLPLAVADHAGPLFKSMFPDSNIAAKYGCARTKTTAIINNALSTELTEPVLMAVKTSPFTLSVDGSNDNGVEKLYPMAVRIWDAGLVKTRFLEMCLVQDSSAIGIFAELTKVFTAHSIPFENCVGLSVDNASVNVGRLKSLKVIMLQKNPALFTLGCPCHLVHNAAHAAGKAFCEATGFNIEDLCVDIYYHFEYSSKRKGLLLEFNQFCDIESRNILKYISTRWLSLSNCVDRILQQFPALESYFLSQEVTKSDTRLKRLVNAFEDPMTEPYLLFFQSSLSAFSTANVLLQSETPCIHSLWDTLMHLIKTIMGRFVIVEQLTEYADCRVVDYVNFQKPDKSLMIGYMTSSKLRTLDDDITSAQEATFYSGVRSFFMQACSYLIERLPSDPCVINARFVNFNNRETVDFNSVLFFIQRFPVLNIHDSGTDIAYDQFIRYQTLTDLPEEVKVKAVSVDAAGNENVAHDTMWYELGVLRDASGHECFGILAKVAKLVLILPHSNADCERIFSMVTKNKTQFRGSLASDKTLPSLLKCKVNALTEVPCHKFKPSSKLLKAAKSATYFETHNAT